jgi:hypothetical protein
LKLAILYILLLMAGPVWAVNDFSSDANCVAVWNHDDGALTADSKSTNTLTNTNVVADTVNHRQGDASGDYEQTTLAAHQTIADADLSATFPLKNGDTNKKISVCFWMKAESVPASTKPFLIFEKQDTNKKTFDVHIGSTTESNYVIAAIGYNSGYSWEALSSGAAIVAGRWYHVAFTYRNSDKAWRFRIWDNTAEALVSTVSGTATNNIVVTDAVVELGGVPQLDGSYNYDGLLDEVVVFNDVLTPDQIDWIRTGVYPGGPPVLANNYKLDSLVPWLLW